MSDVFQNRLRSEQEIPLGATHSTDVAVVPPLNVKIMFNGLNVTDQTRNVIVGQQINLSLKVEPSNATASNIQWTVPGNPIGDYSVNYTSPTAPTSASVVPIGNLQSPQLSFYWVSGADGRQVTLSCKVNQTTFTKTVKFNVKRPTATVTVTTPGSVVLTSAWIPYNRSYGIYFGTPSAVGITFSRSITLPAGFSGDTQWVQLIQTLRKQKLTTNGVWQTRASTDYVLDTKYPASSDASTNDSPGTGLTNAYLQKTVVDSFKSWLMFKPSGNGSIWVPLKVVDWSWSGDASRSGSVWTLNSSSHSTNPASTDTTTFPEWSNNFTLLNYQ